MQIVAVDPAEFMKQIETLVRKVTQEEIEKIALKKKNSDDDEYWKAKDIHRIFGFSNSTINRLFKNGTLPSFKIGDSRFFPKTEVLKAMEKRYQE